MNSTYSPTIKASTFSDNEIDSYLNEIQDLPGHPPSLTTLQDCGYKMGEIHEDFFNVMSSFSFLEFEKNKRTFLYKYDQDLVYKNLKAINRAKYVLPFILKRYEATEKKLKEQIESCIAEKQQYQRNFELRQSLKESLQKKLSELPSDNEEEYKKLTKLNELNGLQVMNNNLSLKAFDMAISLAKEKLGNFDLAKTQGDMWNTNYSIKALQPDNKVLIELVKNPEKNKGFNIRDLSNLNYIIGTIFVLVLVIAGIGTFAISREEIKEPIHLDETGVYELVNYSNPSTPVGKHNKEFFLKNYKTTVQTYNKSQDILVDYLNGSQTLTPSKRAEIQKGYTILLQLADLQSNQPGASVNLDIKYSYEYALGIVHKDHGLKTFWRYYYKVVLYWVLGMLLPLLILNILADLKARKIENNIKKLAEPYYPKD